MDSKELQGLLEAYSEVYTSQEVDEAMTAVASPAPGGRGRKNSYTKEVRTSAATKTSPGYSNVKDAKERMKTPLSKYDTPKMQLKKEEYVDELYKGKHGQSETEYQDSRSNAGKMVSGTSKLSGAAYSYRGVKNTGPNPAGGSEKPKAQGRMTSGQRTELQYRKANLMKKEELDIFDVVLEFLQVEGYAETLEEAEWLMANELDAEDIKAIIETRMDPRGRPSSGPMNVYAKNKPNTDPKFQAALQAVRDADAKKTPEQRQKELDAYKARQANR